MFDVVIVFAGGCVHVGGQGAGLEDGEATPKGLIRTGPAVSHGPLHFINCYVLTYCQCGEESRYTIYGVSGQWFSLAIHWLQDFIPSCLPSSHQNQSWSLTCKECRVIVTVCRFRNGTCYHKPLEFACQFSGPDMCHHSSSMKD